MDEDEDFDRSLTWIRQHGHLVEAFAHMQQVHVPKSHKLAHIISVFSTCLVIGGLKRPMEQKMENDWPKHIKLTTVDIWVVYFTYTLTRTLVSIFVY